MPLRESLSVVCEHVMDLMVCELDELTLIGSMQLPLDWQAATLTSIMMWVWVHI